MVVLGRSNIVENRWLNCCSGESCTVTFAHSRTQDLSGIARRSEIAVAAVGRAGMVKGEWIRLRATVIDRADGLAEPEGLTA